MGRTAKIAVVAVLGALVLTLATLSVNSSSIRGASVPQISGADAPPGAAPVPARCRTATEADAECTAAWDAKRRRFFGEEDEAK